MVALAGCSVVSAIACTWTAHNLALHTLVIDPHGVLTTERQTELSQRLAELNQGQPVQPRFRPIGRATVTINGSPDVPPVRPLIDLARAEDLAAVITSLVTPVITPVITIPATMSDTVVEIWAPDTAGLLWAACRWLADHDLSITSATISTQHGIAEDTFIVHGACDGAALAAHLSPPER